MAENSGSVEYNFDEKQRKQIEEMKKMLIELGWKDKNNAEAFAELLVETSIMADVEGLTDERLMEQTYSYPYYDLSHDPKSGIPSQWRKLVDWTNRLTISCKVYHKDYRLLMELLHLFAHVAACMNERV